MKVLIIGGGIGGLAAAIALRSAGLEIEVVERSTAIREIGAGITLWGNAVKVLDLLGAGEACRKRGIMDCRVSVRTPKGRPLASWSIADLGAHVGTPSVLVHRAELLQDLLDVLGRDPIRLNARCLGFREDEHGVIARFADGREARGDILVGADGLRSAVRLQLFPDSNPRYAGTLSWRAVVSSKVGHDAGLYGETWGRGGKLGLYPLSDGRVYWFVEWVAPQGSPEPPGGRKQEVLDLIRGWHAPLSDVVGATPEDAILRHEIYDIPELPRWTRGRVTLLGDAAHAAMPTFGQGAGQALEDAAVLAKCIRTASDPMAGLRSYDERRRKLGNRVIRLSRAVGRLPQHKNLLACTMRDLMTRVIPYPLQFKLMASMILDEI